MIKAMEQEQWRDIIITKNGVIYNFTGCYMISDLGRVKSVKTGRILSQSTKKDGYKMVWLGNSVNGPVNRYFSVHRLVATMFIDNPNNLPEVDHKNKIRDDNRVVNLEWVTREKNIDNSDVCRKVICIETGEVFPSIKKACESVGIKKGIGDCCRGKQHTAGGYHWQYYYED